MSILAGIQTLVSVDVETWGSVARGGVLLSLGVAIFDMDGKLLTTAEIKPEYDELPDDPSVAEFWAKNPEAFALASDRSGRMSRKESAFAFRYLVSKHPHARLAAWGAHFDGAWVNALLDEHEKGGYVGRKFLDIPSFIEGTGFDVPRVESKAPHVARFDAVAQGQTFFRALARMQEPRP